VWAKLPPTAPAAAAAAGKARGGAAMPPPPPQRAGLAPVPAPAASPFAQVGGLGASAAAACCRQLLLARPGCHFRCVRGKPRAVLAVDHPMSPHPTVCLPT
jgi:hypothetical protein